MSEIAPAVAAPAPAAPSEAAPTEAPAQAAEVTGEPRNAAEFDAMLSRRGALPRTNVAVEVNRVAEQPRNDKGQFVPAEVKVEVPAAAEAPVVSVEPIETKPALTVSVDSRVELPEWHTLRKDRGKRFMDELAPHEQRAVVKDIARLNDAEVEARTLREKLARYEAERAVRSDPAKDPLSNPQNRATYDDLLRAYGKEAAETFRKGLEGDVSAEIDTKAREIVAREQGAARGKQFRADLEAFVVEARSNADLLPAWKSQYGELERRIGEAVAEYAQLTEMGLRDGSVEQFKNDLRLKYVADPRAAHLFREKEARDRAAREAQAKAEAERAALEKAKAEEAERLKAAASARGRNPLSRIPIAGTGVPGNPGPQNAREVDAWLNRRR